MATGSPISHRAREADLEHHDPGNNGRGGLTPISLFLVLVLFWIVIQIGSLLVTALMAVLLGTLLEGPVRRIQERHIPRAAAIAMVYVIGIASVVLIVLLLAPVVQNQFSTFQEGFPETVAELRNDWQDSDNGLMSGPGVGALDAIAEFFEEPGQTVEVTGQTAETAIPILTSVAGGIVSLITALVVTFYYLLEKNLIRRLVIEQLPLRNQARVDQMWTSVEQKTGGWLRGQLVLALIIGVLATTAYGIIGLSFWPLLGLWAGITEIIPIIGPWIGGIPAVIVALTEGPQTAMIVALVIVGMQSLENWVLVPRVMRGAVGLTPMTVFVAIIAGTQLMGIVGAILAIPIAAGVQVVLTDLMDERRSRMSSSAGNVSGWRWMLNRGMGRVTPVDDEDDDGEQPVSPETYGRAGDDDSAGYADWGPSEDDLREPTEEDIDARAEATWPANPWKGKVPSARRAGGWRGMDRAETGSSRPGGGRDSVTRRRGPHDREEGTE
jgi:predicted PurR-regulated permease PerM